MMVHHFSPRTTCLLLLLIWCITFIQCAPDTTVNINFAGLFEGFSPSVSPSPSPSSQTILECELVIVGAGPAGTHTAYQLADKLGSKICLFEAEAEVGGRTADASDANGNNIPLGAIRVAESQQNILDLAAALGIELQFAQYKDSRYLGRGVLTADQLSLKQRAFPLLTDNKTENDYWDMLRFSPKRQMANQYLNFKDYIRDVVSNEGYNYLYSVYRFRGDLQNVDTRGYLDFLDEEWEVCCDAYYPLSGMSQFPKRMAQNATQKGVRLFLSEPVSSISRNGSGFRLTTRQYQVNAQRLVISTTVDKLALIQGDVAKDIQKDAHFQAILSVMVVTINHVWPRRWWEETKLFPSTRRAYTADNCVNFLEIPVHPAGVAANRTRSVYDDGLCNQQWAQLLQTQPLSLVNQRLVKMLQDMYPDVQIPMPTATFTKVWPAAWIFLNPNAPYTVKDIAMWAVQPFANDSKVHLVGENFNPRRGSWIDGAIKSSWNFLESFYGLKRPANAAGPARKRSPQERPPLSETRG